MPTKWMLSPFLYIAAPPPDLGERRTDRAFRGVGAGESDRRLDGPRAGGGVVGPRKEGRQDLVLRRLVLVKPDPAAAGTERVGVFLLVPIRGERVRDQDARRPEERRLG